MVLYKFVFGFARVSIFIHTCMTMVNSIDEHVWVYVYENAYNACIIYIYIHMHKNRHACIHIQTDIVLYTYTYITHMYVQVRILIFADVCNCEVHNGFSSFPFCVF